MENITGQNFKDTIEKGVVFIDFWAGWCGPCMALSPLYEKVAKDFAGKAEFFKCNVDEEQELAVKLSIMSIPCIMCFENGKLKDKLVGLSNESILTNFINRNI